MVIKKLLRFTKTKQFVLNNRWKDVYVYPKKTLFFLPPNLFYLEAWKEFFCRSQDLNFLYLHECRVEYESHGLIKTRWLKHIPFLNEVMIPAASLIHVDIIKTRKTFAGIQINWSYFRDLNKPTKKQMELVTDITKKIKEHKKIPKDYQFLLDFL